MINDKCWKCNMINVLHWFNAGETFKINCNFDDAHACYQRMMENLKGKKGDAGRMKEK